MLDSLALSIIIIDKVKESHMSSLPSEGIYSSPLFGNTSVLKNTLIQQTLTSHKAEPAKRILIRR
jgi:hypothetical protein